MSSEAGPWWRTAVIYEVYPRSFTDTDGDGVGDLPGVRCRLPYLAELGVDAVWLTPIYASPMADGGYDVADHRAVDPLFGTSGDLDALIAQAHELGLRVILDIVPNHTSEAHPWFRAALAAGAGSAERDRYVFRPGRGPEGREPPNDWLSRFGGPAWTPVPGPAEGPQQWYLHLFAAEQPDLNWHHPEVTEDFEDLLRFWFDRGVDGFRIDVANALFKAEGLPDAGSGQHPERLEDARPSPYWDRDEVHAVYRRWRAIADRYPDRRVLIGEAWVHPPERLARYVRGDELHQTFNFDYLQTPWDPVALRTAIDRALSSTAAVGALPTWVLSNHDVVRHRTRFGGGAAGLARARAALLLALALPGAMYLYQGEELGLEQVALPDAALRDPVFERSGGVDRGRDGARVPIPWSGQHPPFGFAPDGTAPWLPMPESWAPMAVTAQADDAGSTLSLYRRALATRRAHLGVADAPLRWLPGPRGALLFTRGRSLLCVVNFGAGSLAVPSGRVVLSSGTLREARRAGGATTLPPDTAVWVEPG